MQSETEIMLMERLKEIDSDIDFLKEEKAKVKQALSLFKGEPVQSTLTSRAVLSNEPTFKQKVCETLKNDYPDGATAAQLLEKLNNNWSRYVKRESLSPQLSRLKNDDRVIGYDQNTGKWFLINKEPPEGGSK